MVEKGSRRIAAALLSVLAAFCIPSDAEETWVSQSARLSARACQADTGIPPLESLAKDFNGPWKPVSGEISRTRKWAQAASLFARSDNRGTFVEFYSIDDPEADSSQLIDYCFEADGNVSWIDAYFYRAGEDSRVDHFEFNSVGTVTKHTAQCVDPQTGKADAVEDRCKEVSAFPIIKRLRNFPFLKH